MNIRIKPRHTMLAFTLVEEMVAMGLVSMISFACLSSISFTRTQRFRDREAGITTDFMTHYVEHLKAIPFDDLHSGQPVNALYDGTAGGPAVFIPPNGSWVSLSTSNYLTFHPELAWVASRQPQYRVTLDTTQVSGQAHTKHVAVEVRWVQPLSTRLLTNRLDLVRVKDL